MTDASRATKKQQELLAFLRDFITEHDYGPSYREIMAGLGYKSVSTVAAHVDGLIAKGYVRRGNDGARSLEIISTSSAETSSAASDVLGRIEGLIKKSEDAIDRQSLIRTLELLGEQARADRCKVL